MGSYLQQYGIADERRNRVIKWIIFTCLGIVVIACATYLFLHNYFEKRVVKNFLAEVNNHNYQAAYNDWCTSQHPCPNYDYNRFLADWGPSKKVESPWKVASVDGCKTFVTVNVQAQGAELQSLAVERNDHSLGFAPSPECQEREWHWRQFFQRIFGGGRS